VEAESGLGKGSTFTVTIRAGDSHLPRERVRAERSTAKVFGESVFVQESAQWLVESGEAKIGSPASGMEPRVFRGLDVAGRRAKVLVADDNTDMRNYIARLLSVNFEVTTVSDGKTALEVIARDRPDLVLSDVMMPLLDGFGLLQAIRGNEDSRSVPVILVSARAGEESRVEGLYAGADDYLVKPFSARELIARVTSHLKMARLREEAMRTEKQLGDALRQQTHRLETLNRIGIALSAELDLEKIVQMATDAGREISRAAFGAFFYNVKNEKGESYTLYTLSGAPREAFAKFPLPRNTALFGPTFKGEGVVRIGDVLKDSRYGKSAPYHGMPKGHLPVRSYLAVPVISRTGEVIGGLFFGHPEPDIFTADAEQHLVAIAAQAAIAIDNAKLYSTVQRELEHVKSAEELNRRMAAIVEFSDDAIISKDLSGIIRSWNPGAQRLFGYTAEEVIGRPLAILIPPERLDEEPRMMAKLCRGEQISHYETVRVRKDGARLDISLTVSALKDAEGKIIGASKIARDVSDQKQAENALREAQIQLKQTNENLEKSVEERTASLTEAIAQMEEFSYSVSHDLRAPVRAMQGYANAALEDYGDVLDEQGREYLRRIVQSGARMDQLIQDVLIYSRLARSDLELQPVSLDALVRDIVRQYPAMQDPNADVEIDGGLDYVLAHEPSLTQAISNLLNNAVKFVVPGSKPKVRIASTREGGVVRLAVKDEGIGIKPEHQARLFGMFERVHNNREYEGTGIGLAIVRKAVERMGGKVGVLSNGEGGSLFWIELQGAKGMGAG
jgi:PAS domain S-box-containing protein